MITKITSQPIPAVFAILGAICACLLFNGKITPSGKYELMANIGLSAYRNLANKEIEWVKKNEIIGVRLRSGNGAKELFVGLQKGSHFKREQNVNPSYCAGTQSAKLAHDRQFIYSLSMSGLDIQTKIFIHSQKAKDESLNGSDTDEEITNLNYVYKKCSKDKIVLLDYDKSNHAPLEEEQAMSRFGLLIQISTE